MAISIGRQKDGDVISDNLHGQTKGWRRDQWQSPSAEKKDGDVISGNLHRQTKGWRRDQWQSPSADKRMET